MYNSKGGSNPSAPQQGMNKQDVHWPYNGTITLPEEGSTDTTCKMDGPNTHAE